MKVFAVARKTLMELLRERMTAGLMLVFPVAIVGFYYVAFGETEEGLAKYLSIQVLNRDEGAAVEEGGQWLAGQAFVDLMRNVEFEDSPVFEVTEVEDRREAEITLREHKASLLVEIPPDFSSSLLKAGRIGAAASPVQLALIGAPESWNYVFARSMLNGLVRQFALEAVGLDETVELQYEFVPGTGTMSDFDFGVSGAIVFGITFGVVITAEVLVREDLSGTLRRMRLTRASAADVLLGVSLALMVVSAIQVPITLGAALAMGFQNNGSLVLIFAIALLMSLTSIGVGLFVACFARTPADATNLASVALVPLVFLSEVIYPMPDVPIASLAGRTIQLYDLLPTTHAAEGMRQVTIYGASLGDIAFEMAALGVLTLLLLLVGVLLYHRRRMVS